LSVARYNVCQSDFNEDGEIMNDDLLAFMDLFAKGDEQADLNEDQCLCLEDCAIAQDLIAKGMP